MTHLRPVLSIKWQNNLVPLHFTVDETEAHKQKMLRAAQPTGLESSSFNSWATGPDS